MFRIRGGTYLFPALIKSLLIPPILTYALIHAFFPKTAWAVRAALYLTSLPLLYALRSSWSIYRSDLAARRSGVRPIARVKGSLPLNIDVLLDWARSGSEEEVGRMIVLLGRKYGTTFNTRVLGEDQIITSDPSVVKHALVDDFDNFVKGHKTRSRQEAFLGDGIFNTDGERWKFHRTLTRPFFHPAHIPPSLFIPHIKSTLSSFPLIDGTAGRSEPFDVQKAMSELSLRIAVDWLCGVDISQPHARGREWDTARKGVGEAMLVAQGAVGRRIKIGTAWPLFELTSDPLETPMRTIRAFFRPLIREAVGRQKQRGSENVELAKQEKLRLIDRLVEATDDLKLVEDQLINILLASRDTTSSLLTFCVYALAIHPEVFNKLRAEILVSVGPDGEITKETIRDCPYTRRFINETLRVFPPVPLNIRRALHSTLLPTATGETLYMPSNTSLVICTLLMQRDKTVWGEDADEFRPERWESVGEGHMQGREGFAAWNLGPRMCLGQPFALTAVHTFLILLIRHLASLDTSSTGSDSKARLVLDPDAQPAGTKIPDTWSEGGELGDGRARGGRDKVWIVSDVVLAVKGGLWVRVQR